MDVVIEPEFEQFVREQVEAGRCASPIAERDIAAGNVVENRQLHPDRESVRNKQRLRIAAVSGVSLADQSLEMLPCFHSLLNRMFAN
jgi:hypothetical protein